MDITATYSNIQKPDNDSSPTPKTLSKSDYATIRLWQRLDQGQDSRFWMYPRPGAPRGGQKRINLYDILQEVIELLETNTGS